MSARDIYQGMLGNEQSLNQFTKGIFDDYDKDGSGELEVSEFREALNQIANLFCLEHLNDEQFLEELKRIDKDGDAKINFDEFKPITIKFLQDVVNRL